MNKPFDKKIVKNINLKYRATALFQKNTLKSPSTTRLSMKKSISEDLAKSSNRQTSIYGVFFTVLEEDAKVTFDDKGFSKKKYFQKKGVFLLYFWAFLKAIKETHLKYGATGKPQYPFKQFISLPGTLASKASTVETVLLSHQTIALYKGLPDKNRIH